MTSEQRDQRHPSHATRSSDSSFYDEICIRCGATDITGGGWGKLSRPCPEHDEVIRMSEAKYPIDCRQSKRNKVTDFVPGRFYLCVRYGHGYRFTDGCAYLCCQTGTTYGEKYLVDDWGRLYSVGLGTVADFRDLEDACGGER